MVGAETPDFKDSTAENHHLFIQWYYIFCSIENNTLAYTKYQSIKFRQ